MAGLGRMERPGLFLGLSMVKLWIMLMLIWSNAHGARAETSVGKEEMMYANGTLRSPWRMHTLFSVECHVYFDWQTVGMMHSFRKSGQPGPITRLLSCTEEQRKGYRGMDLAPTHQVPSMSHHPITGDWYPAINKPAGVVHWLNHNKESENVDWVLILDADQIIRHPITPWALGAEKGKPVAARYGYLIGCDNELAKMHTKHPDLCDKVGGFILMHIDDLRKFAPLWLSKTEEVRNDKEHWATNLTGDIYGKGWISEMYGYSFGAAEVGLRHKINDEVMIYPGYKPPPEVEPLLMHYGLPFKVGDWEFAKLDHHDDDLVYKCNYMFPAPPYPQEIERTEVDRNQLRGDLLSVECINTINEGLLIHHESRGCPKFEDSEYITFLRKNALEEAHRLPRGPSPQPVYYPRIHTLFSAECTPYFDWQTVGIVHSFKQSKQPGFITRLLSCTDEKLKTYRGMDLAATHIVPSMSLHPLTGDWYPAINKPAAVLHWLNHVQTDAEYIIILDADMIMRGPITPWEYGAEPGFVVAAPYDYLIGCDNILAQLHTRNPEACSKVGGVLIIHIDDLRRLAPFWLHKTEDVRADKAHWATNITGDIYQQGWISEMYGYSFGAAEINLRHKRRGDIMLYPGYVPDWGPPRLLHYGLHFKVGDWHFDKAEWREQDMTNNCWQRFPDPPDPATLPANLSSRERDRDIVSIECIRTLNEALHLHHVKRGCRIPPPQLHIQTLQTPNHDKVTINKMELPGAGAEGGSRGRKASRLKHMKTMLKANSQKAMKTFPSIVNPRLWMLWLWACMVCFFLLLVYSLFTSHKASVLKHRKR